MRSNTQKPSLAIGQLWLSKAEPELGIGTLVSHDKRRLKIHFPAGDCFRQYSLEAAPVTRVRFNAGDRITCRRGKKIKVERLEEKNGLISYGQAKEWVCETELDHTLGFSLPQDRLLAGLAGPSNSFDLRYAILKKQAEYAKSPARGFIGGQIDLIPHQFYIAGEITSRLVPRVLLSDETGLGKTIEACLILHQLLITHRIERVLIIVPEALVHQWFVELYRKFCLTLRIFNEEYLMDARAGDSDVNPFLEDQLGIVSVDFIQASREKEQILDAGWDMVVMDEAHHILDQPDFYAFMQDLGKQTPGMMLLTATPEQMGVNTHFSQLRLLDPDRYFDFNAYEKESLSYEKTATRVRDLEQRGKSLSRLLDTYGPGRVIFRNTRASIKGFPERKANLIPLAGGKDLIADVNKEFSSPFQMPERLEQDPRISCLADLARSVKPEKILVICSTKQKAEAVELAIKSHISIDAARFDETMGLLQRDRNAAWFAKKDGARLLICSEIGSEGRNFQFVHHLFLFDLPMNPELLEQRIGRVDRIGQKNGIQVHVPFVTGSIHHVLAHWYKNGLNLFEKNINGAHSIFKRFETRLSNLMERVLDKGEMDNLALNELIKEAAAYTHKTQALLNRGKNILLELNSFKPGPAQKLLEKIRETDLDTGLENLFETVLDHYGMELDRVNTAKGDGQEKINHLVVDRVADEAFPALPRGAKIHTFDRKTAIAREDIEFFTQDHPFVNQVFDFFITQGEGSAATACLPGAGMQGLFIEAVYLLESTASARLGMDRFLPAQPVRVLVSHTGEDAGKIHGFESLRDKLIPDNGSWFMDFEELKTRIIPRLLSRGKDLAQKRVTGLKAEALEHIQTILGKEIHRLVDLQKINPAIKEDEITALKNRKTDLVRALSRAELRLDSVRLIRLSP